MPSSLLLILLLAWQTVHAAAAPTAADIVADYIASKPSLTPYETDLMVALASMEDDLASQTRPVPRALTSNRTIMLHPITFSIPLKHVQDVVPVKANLLASVVPVDTATYAYLPRPHHTPAQLASLERDYYVDMQRSLFGLTWKKSGWDCLRHMELLASGCVPLFTDIAAAPVGVLALYPKRVLRLLLDFPGVRVLQGVPGRQPSAPRRVEVDAANVDQRLYAATVTALLDFTRRHLASDAVAAYMLNVMGVGVASTCANDRLCWVERKGEAATKAPVVDKAKATSAGLGRRSGQPAAAAAPFTPRPTRVLYLAMRKDTVDYMADTLVHGLKALLGDAHVVDHHRRAILYTTPAVLAEHVWAPLRSNQYGWGFSYAHSMLFGLDTDDADDAILRARIAAREFDVVVLSLVHRAPPPLLKEVCTHYPRHRVAAVHGHDRPPTDDELAAYDECAGLQFVREAY